MFKEISESKINWVYVASGIVITFLLFLVFCMSVGTGLQDIEIKELKERITKEEAYRKYHKCNNPISEKE
jgi:hypothetical protein